VWTTKSGTAAFGLFFRVLHLAYSPLLQLAYRFFQLMQLAYRFGPCPAVGLLKLVNTCSWPTQKNLHMQLAYSICSPHAVGIHIIHVMQLAYTFCHSPAIDLHIFFSVPAIGLHIFSQSCSWPTTFVTVLQLAYSKFLALKTRLYQSNINQIVT